MTTWYLGTDACGPDNLKVASVIGPSWYVLQNTIDFSAETVVDADVVEIVNVAAGTFVLGAWVYVHTADTGATDLDLGVTGGDVDCFFDALSMASTGWVHTTMGVNNFGTQGDSGDNFPGVIFTSADTIDLLQNTTGTANTAKATFYFLCINLHDAPIPNV